MQSSATTYAIDTAHSSVDFTVKHMMFTKVRGTFEKVTGTITADENGVPSAISAEIDAASISTRNNDRDTHLKSQDFFHVEQHALITFQSTAVTPKGNDRFSVTGNLTIRGTTNPVTFDAAIDGKGTDPWGNTKIGYSATLRLNRKDYGLTYNAALEAGGVLVGDEIDIELNIQAAPAATATA